MSQACVDELTELQQQRVVVACALVLDPVLLLADEPTGNLDSSTGEAIMSILNKLHTEEGVAILMVTHEVELSKKADRLVRMHDGEVIS